MLDSVLRAFAVMDQPFRSLSVFILLPEFIRDTLYKLASDKQITKVHYQIK